MPGPTPPFSAPPNPNPPLYPSLYLYPLNESFVPKHIALPPGGERVKIGRQTNSKTIPGEKNGYFDSKVLSRQHAEVWEEAGKIFIKDVKSSNGTFINGERLSLEAAESEPFELKSDDIVEFGIDIVGEDNKTIVHHKVAARVVCVFNEQDAQVAARAEQHQHIHPSSSHPPAHQGYPTHPSQGQQPQAGPSGFNFSGPQQQQQQRRQQQQGPPGQGLAGMGGMGGAMRQPGKSGLTFDHILSRLQGELQKSRETGAELGAVTSVMGEVSEVLGGGMTSNLPQYPSSLPPTRSQPQSQAQPQGPTSQSSSQPQVQSTSSSQPPQGSSSQQNSSPLESSSSVSPPAPQIVAPTTILADLQAQLAVYADKVRVLDSVLAEQESIRREMRALKGALTTSSSGHRHGSHGKETERRVHDEDEEAPEGEEYDDDDARSVSTVMPHELERVDEEDEEEHEGEGESQTRIDELEEGPSKQPDSIHEEQHVEENEEERLQRRRDELALGRPHTPEPTNLGLQANGARRGSIGALSPLSQASSSAAISDTEAYSRVLQLVKVLEDKVAVLEGRLATAGVSASTDQENKPKAPSLENEILEDTTAAAPKINGIMKSDPLSPVPLSHVDDVTSSPSLTVFLSNFTRRVEGQWSDVQEEWKEERERLSRAREEWEARANRMDVGMSKLDNDISRLDDGLSKLDKGLLKVDGDSRRTEEVLGKIDKALYRLDDGLGKIDTGVSRVDEGSTRIDDSLARVEHTLSRLHFPVGPILSAPNGNGEAVKRNGLVTPPSPRSRSSDSTRSGTGMYESRRRHRGRSTSVSRGKERDAETDTETTLASSSSSIDKTTFKLDEGDITTRAHLATPEPSLYKGDSEDSSHAHYQQISHSNMNMQAALGVLVLSAAAAAVLWRVKPE